MKASHGCLRYFFNSDILVIFGQHYFLFIGALCTAADRVVKQNPIAISQGCSLNVTEYLSLFFISALSLAHCPDHPEMKAICALQYRAGGGVSEAASGFCLTTPPAAVITAPLKRKGC